ncbi:hypothetical protein JXK06_03215 [Patescibacteria group bacterium]|nr:hypothetical protein [Patescibacteria group bacterium]
MKDEIMIALWLKIAAILITIIFLSARKIKRRMTPFKLAKKLISPENNIEEIFQDLEKIRVVDLDEAHSLAGGFLRHSLKNRFRQEIMKLESFINLYKLIFDLPAGIHTVVYNDFIFTCLEKNPSHWARLYLLAAENDFYKIFFVDQIVSQYPKEQRLLIYDEVADKLCLQIKTSLADSDLSEKENALNNLFYELRHLSWCLRNDVKI